MATKKKSRLLRLRIVDDTPEEPPPLAVFSAPKQEIVLYSENHPTGTFKHKDWGVTYTYTLITTSDDKKIFAITIKQDGNEVTFLPDHMAELAVVAQKFFNDCYTKEAVILSQSPRGEI